MNRTREIILSSVLNRAKETQHNPLKIDQTFCKWFIRNASWINKNSLVETLYQTLCMQHFDILKNTKCFNYAYQNSDNN